MRTLGLAGRGTTYQRTTVPCALDQSSVGGGSSFLCVCACAKREVMFINVCFVSVPPYRLLRLVSTGPAKSSRLRFILSSALPRSHRLLSVLEGSGDGAQ